MIGVEGHEVKSGEGDPFSLRRETRVVKLGGPFQNLRDVRLLKAALAGEELEAVAVERKVGGRDHDRTVEIALREHGGDEHGRRRDKTAVEALGSGKAGQNARFHDVRSEAAVVADAEAEILSCLAGPLLHEGDEGSRDLGRDLPGQVQRLGLGCDRAAADVAAVLKLFIDGFK